MAAEANSHFTSEPISVETVALKFADMAVGDEASLSRRMTLMDLPDDALFTLMTYCDRAMLGMLCRVCRRLNLLARSDHLWLALRRQMLVVGCSTRAVYQQKSMMDKMQRMRVVDQCRAAWHWSKYLRCHRILNHQRQMPWMQLYNDELWISTNNLVQCYRRNKNRQLGLLANRTLRGQRAQRGDVVRFVCKDDVIVSGSVDGSIQVRSISGGMSTHYSRAHNSDVQAVDYHSDLVVSGSRDMTVKLWSTNARYSLRPQKIIQLGDRVCSLAINPNGSSLVIGTSGINCLAPLQVWDLERATLLWCLGSVYRRGAGMLDVHYETPNILVSGGYDTILRLWDLRASTTDCMLSMVEPFDSAIYCVNSDGNNIVLSGTARHGLVQLWDKRNCAKPTRLFFIGDRSTSPVFSLTFDPTALYAGLDRGIYCVDFS